MFRHATVSYVIHKNQSKILTKRKKKPIMLYHVVYITENL